MPKRYSRIRDLRFCLSHFGAALVLLRMLLNKLGLAALHQRLQRAAGRYSDAKVLAFDRRYETDTFERIDLGVLGLGGRDEAFARWQYGPINPDFFREIMRAGPADLHRLTFLDVGSGKGLALMLASEYGFLRIVGVEMSKELNDVARRNLANYAKNGGTQAETELVCADFNLLPLPAGPAFYFLNNPFPEHVAHDAVSHFEASFAAQPREAWILWRRCTLSIIDRLDASPYLDLQVATPYWRLYRTRARVPASLPSTGRQDRCPTKPGAAPFTPEA